MPTTSIVFDPEIDERALDREVQQTNDAFADAASDLDIQTDLGGGGGGRVGGRGLSGGDILLGLAEQRNDLLEDIYETLDEDFVGSSGGGGGGGVAGTGAALTLSALSIPSAGAIGSAVAGAIAGYTSTQLFPEWNVSLNVGIEGAKLLEGGLNWLKNFTWPSTPEWVDNLLNTNVSLNLAIEGAKILENFTWPSAPEWLSPFEPSWPKQPDWLSPFDPSWPKQPDWLSPFDPSWPKEPTWVGPLTNAEWSWPQAPSWVQELLQLWNQNSTRRQEMTRNVGQGRPEGGSDTAERERVNRATEGRQNVTVNNNMNMNMDPQRIAREARRELEPWIETQVENVVQDLAPNPFDSTPGAR